VKGGLEQKRWVADVGGKERTPEEEKKRGKNTRQPDVLQTKVLGKKGKVKNQEAGRPPVKIKREGKMRVLR